MFVRNGETLGSVLHRTGPGAPPPQPQEKPAPAPTPELPPAAEVEVEEPPRGGPNGTREAWASFLDEQGIEYPEDPEEAGRNDLIALWDDREGGE